MAKARPDINELAKGLAELIDNLAPVEEAARGYRAQLERNGWSPAMAEQIAAQAIFGGLFHAINHPPEDG